MQLLIPIFLVLAMYALMIRPQRRRVQAQRDLLTALAPGDTVVTAGGMIGVLRSIDAERATVELAPGVVIELLAPAISRRLSDGTGGPPGTGASLARDAHSDGTVTGEPTAAADDEPAPSWPGEER